MSTGVAMAAPFDDINEQQQRAKIQEREQQARIDAPMVKHKDDELKQNWHLPKEEESFRINQFIIDSNTEDFQWLQDELKEFENQKIGCKGLAVILDKIKTKIKRRGFITTNAYIPEQDIKSRKLIIKIVPGYIEDIKFAGKDKTGIWHNAFPCRPGDILNIYDLDQGIEQMRQVPYQNVKIKLEPGQNAGQSVVLIEVDRTKSWSAGISWDDSGVSATGKHQGSAHISFFNPTGLNDVFNATFSHDTEKTKECGSQNYSIYYKVPYGKYTFYINHYFNEYNQAIPALIPYSQRGTNYSWEIGMQRLLYRDNHSKTQLIAKILHRHKQSFLNNEEIKVQELKTTAYQLGINHRQYIGTGMIDALIYIQKGVPVLGAKPGLDDHNPDYMTTRYCMLGYNFYYGTPFNLCGASANYKLIIRGQYTKDILYSADHFSIGGRYTVKGFREGNSLAAENGIAIKNEISFPLKKCQLEPYIGIDYGHVWGPSDTFNIGKSLAGAYLGIRGKADRLTYDVFVSTPLYKPDGFTADDVVCGFSLNIEL